MTLYVNCREPAAKPFEPISDAMRLCQIGMFAYAAIAREILELLIALVLKVYSVGAKVSPRFYEVWIRAGCNSVVSSIMT